jgi:cation/acetate symporter
VLAAPEIGGLPYWVTCLVAAGGLAAALSTADGLLLTIANSLSHDIYFRLFNPRANAVSRVIASKMLVMVVACWRPDCGAEDHRHPAVRVGRLFAGGRGVLPGAGAGHLLASCQSAGAVAGMLAGLGVCGYYMATNLPLLRSLLGVTGRWPTASGGAWSPSPPGCSACRWAAVMVLVSLAHARPTKSRPWWTGCACRPPANG